MGGPGEPYVESRGTKVSWRPHHTGYISTTKKNNHMWRTLTSLAIWGPGGGLQ